MLRRIYECARKGKCRSDCDASWWCYRHADNSETTARNDSNKPIMAQTLGCMAVEIVPVEEVKNGLA